MDAGTPKQLGLYDSAVSVRTDGQCRNASSLTAQLQQKRQEHELLRMEHIRRFEHEMRLLEVQQRKDEQMLLQMASNDLDGSANTATTISEPTTPPDLRESGDRMRSNTVPVGIAGIATPNRLARLSGSQQLVTPPDDGPRVRTLTASSFGGRRRLSNEDGLLFDMPKSFARDAYAAPRADASPAHEDSYMQHQSKFLFPDAGPSHKSSFLQVNTTDDKFPILVRRESFSSGVGSPPAAADRQHGTPLELGMTSEPIADPAGAHPPPQGWPMLPRSRPTHHHSLSGLAGYHPPSEGLREAAADKRASADVSSTYQLFS
ncbi:uncharacterized protein V1510DRAFT_367199, partial [Dipodascopsis tothii]|uniref:uncharacterized protein n=1 Tax=Dipodascopsis tothii TaxID=44089 RepID=UPI0034CED048